LSSQVEREGREVENYSGGGKSKMQWWRREIERDRGGREGREGREREERERGINEPFEISLFFRPKFIM